MIQTYTFSAAGGHAVNEDAFVLCPTTDRGAWIVALADGQGGRAGGARAAQLACDVTTQHVTRGESLDWVEILTRADLAVAQDREAGFTTLIGLCVRADRVVGASCGDSAAVVMCGDQAPRVLTSRQYKNPPVGCGDASFVPFEMKLTVPWKLLAITDGVWKYAGWEHVWDCVARLSGTELIAELQSAARLALTGEFQDDFTVVLLENE
ncbi:protein serine threonine phosphatase : Protein serine/threonine phosphatase OS=Pedosphaera parvula (strain Ellin514) GN=Cflav_PD6463 PE=4 SV=1: PP2C_2 [Gemmata massiliana]|uniref:PPM-type phosphatase domain-containing protein n=1 Tax=Gemmata massiliana TaxID=1210884 RepID=A0A6P2DPI5_9BACT|nr:protein phosphatase 2C domain-containing protein [Gemmata massiliana]VTS03274.1 protein serine threonine phosphatase : Protein serine/threonine phosphatase OS=Pedosphaera parvula (strain Ellin514) GN=Cflav_PD6463 PE=4 SV=1: PP2C_2 [Gemmata massiliana]